MNSWTTRQAGFGGAAKCLGHHGLTIGVGGFVVA